MPDMLEIIHANMIRNMVQKEIFCVRSGKVLDVRTVKVFRDKDGDPMAVLSPEGLESLKREPKVIAMLEASGVVIPD